MIWNFYSRPLLAFQKGHLKCPYAPTICFEKIGTDEKAVQSLNYMVNNKCRANSHLTKIKINLFFLCTGQLGINLAYDLIVGSTVREVSWDVLSVHTIVENTIPRIILN